MAEVALAASIIRIAGTAAELSLSIYQISDKVKAAKHELTTLAAEVSLFSQCLNTFSKTVEWAGSENVGFKDIAMTLVESCRALLLELAKVVYNIAPLGLSDDPDRKMGLGHRLKWVLKEPKVNSLRKSMESFKTTLLLLLSAADYAHAKDSDAPRIIQ